MGRGRRLDGDRERDHIRPEGNRERPEGRDEDESDHQERRAIVTMANAAR